MHWQTGHALCRLGFATLPVGLNLVYFRFVQHYNFNALVVLQLLF